MKALIKISPFTPVVYLIFALTDGLYALSCIILCVLLHESAHLAAMYIKKVPVEKIKIYPFGVKIAIKEGYLLNYRDEIFCVLSGPFINLLTGLFFICLQKFSGMDFRFLIIFSLFLFLLNILPIMPLDGGRALLCFLSLKLSLELAGRISDIVSVAFLLPVIALGIYILKMTGYNFTLLLTALYLSVSFLAKNLSLKDKPFS